MKLFEGFYSIYYSGESDFYIVTTIFYKKEYFCDLQLIGAALIY